ncbi:MAG: YncE family protein [Prevotella conceptionensis]
MKRFSLFYLACLILAMVSSCREDFYIIPSQNQDTGVAPTRGDIVGMYVLNEGNMGSNKASIDFLDLDENKPTVHYHRNIYSERNPNVVKELGDVGNDIKIYGSKLWIVVNVSNKVEVATADSCKRITQINIPNCRYLAFKDGFAYVSSYVGPVKLDQDVPLGMVYKVDTVDFKKKDSVVVSYQPEGLCIVDNKLYVANSGGYRAPNYDNTLSEIDLTTFKEIRKIKVGLNLHHCQVDHYGQIWVTSRGNYNDVPSRIYWLYKGHNQVYEVIDSIDTPVSGLSIVGDSLYYYGSAWNNATKQNTISYGLINVRTHQTIDTNLFSSPEVKSITMPYGIMVNPIERDFYLMDAKNYVSSGSLLHFKPNGTHDFTVQTGDIPGPATFVYK